MQPEDGSIADTLAADPGYTYDEKMDIAFQHGRNVTARAFAEDAARRSWRHRIGAWLTMFFESP